MAEENITTKYKIDISEFKAGISEANKQIKLANAEFKAASAGMDNWSESTEGIQAKLKQLAGVLDAQKSKLNNYKSQLEAQKQAYNENGRRADELKAKLQELADRGISQASEEYKQYQKALIDVEKEQAVNQRSIDDLNVSILNQQGTVNGIERDIRNYENTLNDLRTAEADAAKEAEKSTNAYNTLKSSISDQEKRLAELKEEYANVVLEQGKNSEAAQSLANEINDLSNELSQNRDRFNDANRAADEFDESLSNVEEESSNASDGFTVMKGILANLATQAITAVINGLKDMAKAAYEAWQAYDKGADTVIAATGATGEAAAELSNVYSNLTKTVKAEFSDIGAAVGEVNTRFGLTGDALEEASAKFLKFAKINGVDVKTAIDNTQAAMAAFGLGAENTSNMIDVLNKAGQDTGISVDKLAQSLTANAPALQEMGYNASDSAMFIANLEKSGVEASAVLTGMKKALATAAKEGKPMSDAMSEIEDSIKSASSSTEAITIATELFGTKTGPAIATAVREGKLSFEEFGTTLTDFQDNVESTYDSMLDLPDKATLALQGVQATAAELFKSILSGNTEILNKAASDFKNKVVPSIADLLPELRNVLSRMTDLFGTTVPEILKTFFDQVKNNITPIAEQGTQLVLALATAIIKAIPQLIKGAIKMIGGILKGIKKALPSVLSAIIEIIPQIIQGLVDGLPDLIQGAITLLLGIVDAIPVAIETIMQALPQIVDTLINGLVTGIPALIDGALQLLMGIVNAIPKIIPIITQNLPLIINSVVTGLINGVNAIIQGTVQLLMGIIQAIPILIEALIPEIPTIITTIVDVLMENVPVLLEGAIQLFMALVEAIPTICLELAKAIPQIITAIFEGLAELPIQLGEYFTGIWGDITDIFSPAVEWFKKLFSNAWNGIVNIWNTAAKWFNDYVVEPIKSFFEPLVTFFTELWTVISGLAKGTWEIIKQVWEVVGDWFNKNVITPVTNFFTTLWNGISTAASNAWDVIKGVWNVVSDWFNNNIVSPVANFFSGMWDGIKAAASDAWEGIKSIFKPVADWFEEKFSAAWTAVKNVFSTGGKIFDGIKDGIVSAFKEVVNAIIRGINKVISVPFNAINGILNSIRDIGIMDMKPFAGLWGKNPLSIPQIPLLAKGGILEKGQMGLLEGSGAEAVVPLENNKKWIRAVANDLLSELRFDARNGANTNNSSNSNYTFNQVINAPKQPSRIELYRQTRNLLAYAKGVT